MKRHELMAKVVTRVNRSQATTKRPHGKTADVHKLAMARTAGIGLGMCGKAVTARKIDPRIAAVRELLRAIGRGER